MVVEFVMSNTIHILDNRAMLNYIFQYDIGGNLQQPIVSTIPPARVSL